MFTRKLILFFLSLNLLSGAVLSGADTEYCQGKESCPKPELNILFLGKTGVGKSTLINLFYNHIKGNSYTDPRDVVIPLLHGRASYEVNVEDFKAYNLKLKKGGGSQTEAVHQYRVENEFYSVTLWDAPGFLDTEGDLKDIENARLIASAMDGVPIHAAIVVLKAEDVSTQTLECKALINRIRLLLPKTFLPNTMSIFTRAGSFNKIYRQDLTRKFGDLFEMHINDVKPKAFFIDGSNFFDEIDDADDNVVGQATWSNDGRAVAAIIAQMQNNTPAAGEQIKIIQTSTEELEQQVKTMSKELMSLQFEVLNLKIIKVKLENNRENKEANANFEKDLKVAVAVKDVERTGWWIFGGYKDVERIQNQIVKVIDEGQRRQYEKALEDLKTNEDKEASLNSEIQRLQARQKEMVTQIAKLQKEMEKLAMTTNRDACIVYLEDKIRQTRVDTSFKQEEIDILVELYMEWIDTYNDLRRSVK